MRTRPCEALSGVALGQFMAQIRIQPGCWEWMGSRDIHGYGRVGSKSMLVHRLAYASFVGPIDDGLLVCHHCDNPPCCNPAHLFLGTHQDNLADAALKDRFPWRKAAVMEPRLTHHLTPDRVQRIRQLLAEGYTQRQVARFVDVDHSTVSRLSRRLHWTEAATRNARQAVPA